MQQPSDPSSDIERLLRNVAGVLNEIVRNAAINNSAKTNANPPTQRGGQASSGQNETEMVRSVRWNQVVTVEAEGKALQAKFANAELVMDLKDVVQDVMIAEMFCVYFVMRVADLLSASESNFPRLLNESKPMLKHKIDAFRVNKINAARSTQ